MKMNEMKWKIWVAWIVITSIDRQSTEYVLLLIIGVQASGLYPPSLEFGENTFFSGRFGGKSGLFVEVIKKGFPDKNDPTSQEKMTCMPMLLIASHNVCYHYCSDAPTSLCQPVCCLYLEIKSKGWIAGLLNNAKSSALCKFSR